MGDERTKVESIPGRGCEDDDYCEDPFDQVRSEWRIERTSGSPEARERKDTLPVSSGPNHEH